MLSNLTTLVHNKINNITIPNMFTGIGKLGKSKTFAWQEVTRIHKSREVQTSRKQQGQIVIDAAQPIRFGLGLSQERRYYIFHALKKIQTQYKPERR